MKTINKKQLFLVIGSIIVLLSLFTIIYLYSEANELKYEKYEYLTSINSLKLAQLNAWIDKRISEAEFFPTIGGIIKSTQELSSNINNPQAKKYLSQSLAKIKSHDYCDNIYITNTNCDVLFSLDSTLNKIDPVVIKAIKISLEKDSLVFADFYFSERHNEVHLNIISPIKDNFRKIIGSLVQQIDLDNSIYPIIQKWPTTSKTAETLLFRKDSTGIVYISNLRHKDNSKLSVKLELTDTNYVPVKIFNGARGVIEGRDYRNVEVLASAQQVPGTNWFLDSKMDMAEINSELLNKGEIILVMLTLFILIIASGSMFLYKQRQSETYKSLFLREKELNENQIKTKSITDSTHDAIVMIDKNGIVKFWNPAAERIFEYSSAEVLNKNLRNLILPKHYHSVFNKAISLFQETGTNGLIGRTFEVESINKSGKKLFLELALSAIKSDDGLQAVGIMRDVTERKRIETKLHHSEEMFRLSFEYHVAVMLLIDPDTGYINNANKAASNFYGYSVEKLCSMNISEINTLTSEQIAEERQQAKLKSSKCFNFKHKLSNGEIRDVEVHSSPINAGEKLLLFSVVHDITERKVMADALKESEMRFRTLVEQSPFSIQIFNPEGNTISINDAYCKMWNVSETDMAVILNHFNILKDEQIEAAGIMPYIKRGFMGEFVQIPTIYYDPQNSSLVRQTNIAAKWVRGYIWPVFDDNGKVRLIVLMHEDITEHKRVQDQLKESEIRFRTMADSSPALIWMSGTDKLCNYFNKTWLEFTGRTFEQENGNGWAEGVHPDDLSRCLEIYVSAFDKREPFAMEYRLRRSDGEYGWIYDEGVPRFASEGSFVGYIGSCTIITDRKKTEKELKESEELFRHSFDYSAVGMCIVGTNRKFEKINNSLSKIFGYSESEIKNYTFDDITFAEDVLIGQSQFKLMIQGEITNAEFEKRYVTKNKKVIWTHVVTSLVRDSNKQPRFFITQILDITDHKKIEETIKESEENYRHIINGMSDIVFVINSDGKFLDVNNAAVETLGYTKEELLSRGPADIDNNINKDEIMNKINTLSNDSVQIFETIHTTKDGRNIPVEIKSTLIPFKGKNARLSICRNITERKKADLIVKESEEKYRTLFTQMQLGVAVYQLICDNNGKPVDYRFIEMNQSYEKLTGLERNKVIGKRISEIFPDKESSWIEKYGSVALNGIQLSFVDYAEELDKYFSVIVYRPQPMQFAVIIDDITESKKSETALTEQLEEISRFNKLMIGREERMIALKLEVNQLLEAAGKEKRYNVNVDEE